MISSIRDPIFSFAAAFLWAVFASFAGAAQTVCSSQNTGSTPAKFDQYQSNGWCSNACGGYSYAIVQDHNCWCSNTEPSSQTSVGSCNSACPGYGYENCGNADEGLFGYIYLGAASSSSSIDASSSTSSASSSPSLASSSSITGIFSSSSSSSSSSISSSSSSSSSSVSSSASSSSSSNSYPSSSSSSSTSSTGYSSSSSSVPSTSSSSSTTSTSASTSSSSFSSSLTTSSSQSASSTLPSSSTTPPSSTSSSSSSSTSSSSSSSASSSSSSSTKATGSETSGGSVSSVKLSYLTVTASPTADGSSGGNVYTTEIVTTVISTPTGQVSAAPNSNGADANKNRSSGKGFWGSPGKIAGTFVAVGIVVFLLALLAFVLWYRRRNHRDEDFEKRYNDVVAPVGSNTSIGPASSASPNGFIYADEKGIQRAPPASSENNEKRGSQETSVAEMDHGSAPEEGPVVVDQRLDPRQMFMMQWENGGSKMSLADDVDYSRKVLRVMND
ncbi:Wsc4p LALA0_S01e13696g [Lachancea lanzarotensis]|uniref:LALA0S01e13696g1_1 n=1 Tax=Lachancea lanzarotensis TaxID=1245769 RepID=A0A0C7N1X9_9SACH|nr:uncharacterized protein LALA0_S01e13696g [Lachancea lanzarotensis]CEP60559.1 LALA0S01e13696g1_1 [Lachancea lanzarotensis]